MSHTDTANYGAVLLSSTYTSMYLSTQPSKSPPGIFEGVLCIGDERALIVKSTTINLAQAERS